jgi:1,2-diacylglycerol 3-beta-galactosyltransferase
MPQERWNTQWIREQGLGLVLSSRRGLPRAVKIMTARLQEFRARATSIRNEAVFEVVDVLADLLDQVDSASPAMISMERPFVSG